MESYGYTPDGHRAWKKDHTKNETLFYSWDADGMLTAVCRKAKCGSEDAETVGIYIYDESGNRVLKKTGKKQKIDTIYLVVLNTQCYASD